MEDANKIKVVLMTSFCGPGYFVAPPIGLYRIKYVLEQNNIPTVIWDQSIDDKSAFFQRLTNGEFNIIGFSVSHYFMSEDLQLLWSIQCKLDLSNKKALFVAGGHEASMNPKQWLENGIDIVLPGFAENSMLSLCQNVKRHYISSDLTKLVENIDGYVFLEKNKLIQKPRSLLSQEEFTKHTYENVFNLEIPFERYWNIVSSRLSKTKYQSESKGKFFVKNIRLYTTSHCRRGCGFCASQSFIRMSQTKSCPTLMLSAKQLLKLVVFYVNHIGAESFMFSDDDFPVGSMKGLSRLEEFCDLIIDAKNNNIIPKNITFSCQARIQDFIKKDELGDNIVNENIIKLLKKSGFQTIAFGVETFSDRLLNKPSINKKNLRVQDSINVINSCLNNHLVPQINIILGIPETNIEEIFYSMDEAVKYIIEGCQISVTPFLNAFPGSPIFENSNYIKNYKTISNPKTGKLVYIANNYFIKNIDINDAFTLLDKEKEEQIDLITNTFFSKELIPKYVVALATFIAAANLLGRKDWAEKLISRITSLIQ